MAVKRLSLHWAAEAFKHTDLCLISSFSSVSFFCLSSLCSICTINFHIHFSTYCIPLPFVALLPLFQCPFHLIFPSSHSSPCLYSHFCPAVLSAKGKPLPLSHGKSRNGRIRSNKLGEIDLSLGGWPSVPLTRFHILPIQAFESLLQLYEARATYEEFCIPMCMLPATISNNVPGTDLSIGADTALNAIVEVRQSNRRWHNFDRFVQDANAKRMKMTHGKKLSPVLILNRLSGPTADVQWSVTWVFAAAL